MLCELTAMKLKKVKLPGHGEPALQDCAVCRCDEPFACQQQHLMEMSWSLLPLLASAEHAQWLHWTQLLVSAEHAYRFITVCER